MSRFSSILEYIWSGTGLRDSEVERSHNNPFLLSKKMGGWEEVSTKIVKVLGKFSTKVTKVLPNISIENSEKLANLFWEILHNNKYVTILDVAIAELSDDQKEKILLHMLDTQQSLIGYEEYGVGEDEDIDEKIVYFFLKVLEKR